MDEQFNITDEDSETSDASHVADPPDKKTRKRNVLVIEDSVSDYEFIKRLLNLTVDVHYVAECAVDLSVGLQRLHESRFHVVLLDLLLPDSEGMDSFQRLYRYAPHQPIIVLTSTDDEELAAQVMREGAADYLVKGKITADLLVRSINYARARHHMSWKLSRALQAAQSTEANLRNIITSSTDGILVVDQQGIVHFSNPAAHRLFRCTEAEILRDLFGLPLSDDAVSELDLPHYGGGHVPVEMHSVAVQWATKPAWLVTLRDLTRRKQAEATLRASEERNRAIRINIEMALRVQRKLFPAKPNVPQCDLDGVVLPAEHASGDYYDFIPMSQGAISVVLGDVSGHGLGPALIMAQTQAYLRALAHSHDDPGDILTHANRFLRQMETERFVAMVYAVFDPQTGAFVYCCAGHTGFILKLSGEVIPLSSQHVPIGILDEQVYTTAPAIHLEFGDLVLLPTDGVWEATSPNQETFGEQQMLELVSSDRGRSASEITHRLCQAVRDFEGPLQQDDITAVVLKYGDPTNPGAVTA